MGKKANGLFEHATLNDLCRSNCVIVMYILADLFWDFLSLIYTFDNFPLIYIFYQKKDIEVLNTDKHKSDLLTHSRLLEMSLQIQVKEPRCRHVA